MIFPPSKPFVMVVSGPPESGKSFLICSLIEHRLHTMYDNIFIISPTFFLGKDYDSCKQYFTGEFKPSPGIIDKIYEDQLLTYNEAKDDPDLRCPTTLLIIDDSADSTLIRYRGEAEKIAQRCRHINMSLIVISQGINTISTNIKRNAGFIILFNPYAIAELESFLNQFILKYDRPKFWDKIKQIFRHEFYFLCLCNAYRENRGQIYYGNLTDMLTESLHKV